MRWFGNEFQRNLFNQECALISAGHQAGSTRTEHYHNDGSAFSCCSDGDHCEETHCGRWIRTLHDIETSRATQD